MIRNHAVMAFVGMLVISACAASPLRSESLLERTPVSESTAREDIFPVMPAAFPDDIVAYPHVEYANIVGFRPLYMDIYKEKKAIQPRRPLVIWIHGGAWRRGDSRTSAAYTDWPGVLAGLAARGYAVASIDYRLTGEARFPAAVRDVNASIEFLRRNADVYGIDPDNVILWGGSAGAHLAALSALTCNDPNYEPELSRGRSGSSQKATPPPSVSHCVQGVVTWFGPFDLTTLSAATVPELMGCRADECPDEIRTASPLFRINRKAPPMLIMHGDSDRSVPEQQSIQFAGRLKEAGNRVETVYLPGADHGWMGETPDETRALHIKALKVTYDFIDRVTASRNAEH